MDTYRLQVAGLERDLPVCPLGNGVSIAGFVMVSDVELTIACATELLKRLPEYDVLLTAESKGIPLAYEMSRQGGKRYILARKSKKLYKPCLLQHKNSRTLPVKGTPCLI